MESGERWYGSVQIVASFANKLRDSISSGRSWELCDADVTGQGFLQIKEVLNN